MVVVVVSIWEQHENEDAVDLYCKPGKLCNRACMMCKYKAKLPFVYTIRSHPNALTMMWNREHSQN